MTRPSRRTLLCSTATLIGLSAGCIADSIGSPADNSDDRNDTEEGSPSADADPESTDGESEDLPDGLTDYETQPYQYATESTASQVELVRDADDAAGWLEDRSLSDTDPVADFVDAIDFETSILVSLEDGVPNPCHKMILDSIDIEDIEDDGSAGKNDDGDGDSDAGDGGADGGDGDANDGGDEKLVLKGTVQEESDGDVCTTQTATVGQFVRVTFESEPLTTISATIVGHDGSTTGASMSSDSASASESTSVDSASDSGSDS